MSAMAGAPTHSAAPVSTEAEIALYNLEEMLIVYPFFWRLCAQSLFI
jgi:hypothetical protein